MDGWRERTRTNTDDYATYVTPAGRGTRDVLSCASLACFSSSAFSHLAHSFGGAISRGPKQLTSSWRLDGDERGGRGNPACYTCEDVVLRERSQPAGQSIRWWAQSVYCLLVCVRVS